MARTRKKRHEKNALGLSGKSPKGGPLDFPIAPSSPTNLFLESPPPCSPLSPFALKASRKPVEALKSREAAFGRLRFAQAYGTVLTWLAGKPVSA